MSTLSRCTPFGMQHGLFEGTTAECKAFAEKGLTVEIEWKPYSNPSIIYGYINGRHAYAIFDSEAVEAETVK